MVDQSNIFGSIMLWAWSCYMCIVLRTALPGLIYCAHVLKINQMICVNDKGYSWIKRAYRWEVHCFTKILIKTKLFSLLWYCNQLCISYSICSNILHSVLELSTRIHIWGKKSPFLPSFVSNFLARMWLLFLMLCLFF